MLTQSEQKEIPEILDRLRTARLILLIGSINFSTKVPLRGRNVALPGAGPNEPRAYLNRRCAIPVKIFQFFFLSPVASTSTLSHLYISRPGRRKKERSAQRRGTRTFALCLLRPAQAHYVQGIWMHCRKWRSARLLIIADARPQRAEGRAARGRRARGRGKRRGEIALSIVPPFHWTRADAPHRESARRDALWPFRRRSRDRGARSGARGGPVNHSRKKAALCAMRLTDAQGEA